jgi:hypothetical protein
MGDSALERKKSSNRWGAPAVGAIFLSVRGEQIDPLDFSRAVHWHTLPPTLAATREAIDAAMKLRPVSAPVRTNAPPLPPFPPPPGPP